MNKQWLEFLKDMGAEFSGNVVKHFGNPERENRASDNGLVVADLSHLCLVKASGVDAGSFLQGQLTNDIDKVMQDASQLSGYCNQKGRLLAIFRIFKKQDDLFLLIPEELYEETFKRLKMYVMRSKVDFTNCSADFACIGFSGPNADSELQNQIKVIPTETDQVTHIDDLSIIKLSGNQPRYQICGPADQLSALWQNLDVNATAVGKDVWNLLEIRAGIPAVYQQTVEAFVPQMLNLELINGVSFKKGCYTGQEIVARMHYLGKVKRRMYRVHIQTSEMVLAGAPLFSPNSTSGQGTGNIVIAAPAASEKGYEALAVIQVSESESKDLRLNDGEGPAITILEIPYELPAEKE
ncbi:MAG: folate-binding protein [Gammaproteobacteria bacterium]|nr:folate-binding protein [Gammaproteobacteria bacterium]